MAQMVKNLPATRESWVRFLSREDPLETGMATHSSIHVGEFHGQGARRTTVHGVTKSQTRQNDRHSCLLSSPNWSSLSVFQERDSDRPRLSQSGPVSPGLEEGS